MKAYYVTDKEEERGAVFFGETASKAKSRACNDGDLMFDEYTELRARRMPQFDKYANIGEVPKQELLDNGWWFWCENSCCHKERITKEDGAVIVDGCVLCAECAAKKEGGSAQ